MIISYNPTSLIVSIVSFYVILLSLNVQDQTAYVKPKCGDIGQADDDLAANEEAPAVAAFYIPL